MLPSGERNRLHYSCLPMSLHRQERSLVQETAVACLLNSHSFWLVLAATLLVTARTVAHKKAIMVTSTRPACFVGFFIREYFES